MIDSDQTVWEQFPLKTLAKEEELMCFKHLGFWQPMDTQRDKNYLNRLWNNKRSMESMVENQKVNPEFWVGKKVFITGHSGFKGSWLSIWLMKLAQK